MKGTNRILPVYSADISGVCSALYELGGMTIMHDASGCNSTYTTHDEPRWYSMDSMVYISALSELEAVMGDDEKLVRDIVDAAGNLKPLFICVGGTPIPMIMGTDFKGIARMIEQKTGIPTFGIAANGMHSYIRGAKDALKWIAKRFCLSKEELSRVRMEGDGKYGEYGKTRGEWDRGIPVNILGATPLDFSLTGNVANMKLFLEANGIEVVSCWAMESSLDEIKLAGIARVNLVVSAAGLLAAEELQEMYGTPYVVGTPVGRRPAGRVVELIKRAAETEMAQVLFSGENGGEDRDVDRSGCEDGRVLGLEGLPGNLAEERILIAGEQIIANSMRCSLREDCGAVQVSVLCPTEGEAAFAEEGDMLLWDEDEAVRLMVESTVVVADPLYRQACPPGANIVFVTFPHEACSGRMYHDIMKPFVNGDLSRKL